MNYVEPMRNKEDVKAVENYLMNRSMVYGVIFAIGVNTGLRVSGDRWFFCNNQKSFLS